jgi:MFS family permease
MAMSQAAIADVVSPRERGRYQGYMASTWGFASVAGPVVGGWVTMALSWRWIFWINIPISLLAMLLCDRSLRLLKPRSVAARIDWAGAGLLTAMVTCWLLVLSWGGVEMPWTATPIIALATAGALLIVLLTVQERRSPDPLMPPRLFANAVFVRGVCIAFCASAGMFGASFLLPLFFQLVRGDNAAMSGALVAPFLGAVCVGATITGTISRRRGRMKALLLTGLSICGAGFVMLSFITAATLPIVLLFLQGFIGIGLGMAMPGCMLFLRSMGGAFGSTLVGALLAGGFASHVLASGITAHIDLGEVRQHGGVIAGIDASLMPLVKAALVSSFHMGFLACAAALGVALVTAAGMRDLPLRGAAPEGAPAEPAVLAH